MNVPDFLYLLYIKNNNIMYYPILDFKRAATEQEAKNDNGIYYKPSKYLYTANNIVFKISDTNNCEDLNATDHKVIAVDANVSNATGNCLKVTYSTNSERYVYFDYLIGVGDNIATNNSVNPIDCNSIPVDTLADKYKQLILNQIVDYLMSGYSYGLIYNNMPDYVKYSKNNEEEPVSDEIGLGKVTKVQLTDGSEFEFNLPEPTKDGKLPEDEENNVVKQAIINRAKEKAVQEFNKITSAINLPKIKTLDEIESLEN